MSTHIPVSGTPNMRDLGGITTADGRKIKHHKLIRSGSLTNLTRADWQLLEDRNLKIICDFRTHAEREHSPTHAPDSMDVSLFWLEIKPGDQNKIMSMLEDNTATPEICIDSVQQTNREFVQDWSNTFSQFLQQVLALETNSSL